MCILHYSKKTQANCQASCEETTNHRYKIDKPCIGGTELYCEQNDCHLLCFVEWEMQMKGKHSCELLDEDRFATPDDLIEEKGYEYYDMSREYEKEVRYYDTINMMVV